jgi:UDP-N-acetylglucosamine enolpyruvyl transferase
LDVEINDDDRGTLPFTVVGKGFVAGGSVTIDASESSQFVSALLLAGCRYYAGVSVIHSGSALPSMPHIDMSVEVLRELGIRVDVDIKDSTNATWTVHPGVPRSFNVTVEPDLSNAAPFLAAALVCGGSVTIPDWPTQTTQAGNALVSLLPKLGATVSRDGSDLVVTGGSQINGIDVDFENVGGAIFDCVLERLNDFARIALCGMISQYNLIEPDGIRNIGEILNKNATLQGFRVTSYPEHRPQAQQDIKALLRSGTLQPTETFVEGLEAAPQAFVDLFKGANLGKLVVRV